MKSVNSLKELGNRSFYSQTSEDMTTSADVGVQSEEIPRQKTQGSPDPFHTNCENIQRSCIKVFTFWLSSSIVNRGSILYIGRTRLLICWECSLKVMEEQDHEQLKWTYSWQHGSRSLPNEVTPQDAMAFAFAFLDLQFLSATQEHLFTSAYRSV